MSRGIFPSELPTVSRQQQYQFEKRIPALWIVRLIQAPQASHNEYSEKQQHIQNLKSKMVLPLLTPYVCKQKNTFIPEFFSTISYIYLQSLR